MKFATGDEIDRALAIAIKHEFMRCDDAFNEFAQLAKLMITKGENRRIAYKTYNAYARFVHHLYEFMLAAISRDRNNTAKLQGIASDQYIASQIQRVLTNRRAAILNGTAPSWENHISAYPEKIPATLAKDFRQTRNTISGHAIYKRAGLNLSDFYVKNHKFLYLIYYEAKSWWGRESDQFPDLEEITAFSVLIKDDIDQIVLAISETE